MNTIKNFVLKIYNLCKDWIVANGVGRNRWITIRSIFMDRWL